MAIGDLDVDLAQAASRHIAGEVVALPLDVTSAQSFSVFLDETEAVLGPLDVLVNNAGVATYCATKFGVVGLTHALREELRPHGIAVCAILPGIVHTELSAGLQLPAEQFVSVEPEDIAKAVTAAARTYRVMTHVPRRMRWAVRAGLAMPERPRRFLSRITRTEQVYLDVELATRDAYHTRT